MLKDTKLSAFFRSHPGIASRALRTFKWIKALALTAWNLLLAVWFSSFWYLTAAVYQGLTGGLRLCAARFREENGVRWMRISGVVLLLLGAVVSGTVTLSLTEDVTGAQSLIPLIGTAALTFYKAVAAVVRASSRKRDRSPREITVRCVTFAEISMAMLTLERTMIVSLDEDGSKSLFFARMTGSLGMAVFLVTVGAGVVLLWKKPSEAGIPDAPGEDDPA